MTLPMALIIGGHPRSGTTILNRLCQLHPEIAMTGEFRSFQNLNLPYLEYVRGLRMDWYRRGIVSHAGRNAPLRAKLLSLGFLAIFLGRLLSKARRPIGVQDVGWALHGIFPRAKVVGDKYPRYVFSLDDLVTEKDLKRVIIYRDARDVVSSYLRMVETAWKDLDFVRKNSPNARRVAHAWVRSIELMEQHESKLHIIRYETLCDAPRRHLDELANYLGVSSEGFKHNKVRATSVGRYTDGLTQAQVEDVLQVAGPTLERLNYPV